MKRNASTIWLVLVVFLLGTNVATVLTYRNHLRSETKKSENKIEIPENQYGRFFQDNLELDEKQQDAFRNFRRTYNRGANKLLREMQDIRSEMAEELKPVHPDRKKLDKLAGQLGHKHEQLKKLTFDYYQNMQNVLEEGQQQKMAEIFQALLTSEGDARKPGQGRQGGGQGYGRGQGWQNNSDSVQNNN